MGVRMLQLRDLSLPRGSKLLFADVDATICPGRKVGVVGFNEYGKRRAALEPR